MGLGQHAEAHSGFPEDSGPPIPVPPATAGIEAADAHWVLDGPREDGEPDNPRLRAAGRIMDLVRSAPTRETAQQAATWLHELFVATVAGQAAPAEQAPESTRQHRLLEGVHAFPLMPAEERLGQPSPAARHLALRFTRNLGSEGRARGTAPSIVPYYDLLVSFKHGETDGLPPAQQVLGERAAAFLTPLDAERAALDEAEYDKRAAQPDVNPRSLEEQVRSANSEFLVLARLLDTGLDLVGWARQHPKRKNPYLLLAFLDAEIPPTATGEEVRVQALAALLKRAQTGEIPMQFARPLAARYGLETGAPMTYEKTMAVCGVKRPVVIAAERHLQSLMGE